MSSEEFNQFLNNLSLQPIPAIDPVFSVDKYFKIDISEKNKDLLNFDVSSASEWDTYINSCLKKNKNEVDFVGYIEKRNLY